MTTAPEILATTGESFDFGGLGVEWRIDGPVTGGRFAVVHHPIAPRALAAPLHRHHREDEYSYELDMDFDSVPGLCERFGLTFPEL